jgi:NAD-dependent deacetylase sirtuin 5
LHLLHGSLYDIKCTHFYCNYVEHDNFKDPIVPALALPTDESDPTTTTARQAKAVQQNGATPVSAPLVPQELDISDINVPLPELPIDALPKCPSCNLGLLRPGVVWFGERLPEKVLEEIQTFIDTSPKIDIILVVGTSASVYPAAGYVDEARAKGARVAVINTECDLPASGLEDDDWLFQGDAAVILPELLKPLIGDLRHIEEKL